MCDILNLTGISRNIIRRIDRSAPDDLEAIDELISAYKRIGIIKYITSAL